MAAVLSKRQMTEEDIKLQFITPAITKKWALSLITMETRITDGQINLRGNMVSRKEAKKADYILYLNESTPIAIVEAKDNKHAVGDGLQQAMQYAIMMDIPFAYSSNGDGFMEIQGWSQPWRRAHTARGIRHSAAVLFRAEYISPSLLSA